MWLTLFTHTINYDCIRKRTESNFDWYYNYQVIWRNIKLEPRQPRSLLVEFQAIRSLPDLLEREHGGVQLEEAKMAGEWGGVEKWEVALAKGQTATSHPTQFLPLFFFFFLPLHALLQSSAAVRRTPHLAPQKDLFCADLSRDQPGVRPRLKSDPGGNNFWDDCLFAKKKKIKKKSPIIFQRLCIAMSI